jgi:2-polyprenyl-3-methyl-5-hydroxy-6-metoxy-1,4-benzoquinol methylase
MNEQRKYERMWEEPVYRSGDGGLGRIEEFMHVADVQKGQTIVDFGCGEGRTLRPLLNVGANVVLVDIADNCLAEDIPRKSFIRHDMSERLPLVADTGFCVDMMEHVPTQQVDDVLINIFDVVKDCYFVVSTTPDACGRLIGEVLHLTVQPFMWWKRKFAMHGTVKMLNKTNVGFTVFVSAT